MQLVKLILKLIWKGRRTKVAQTIKNKFLKKEKVGGITLFNFKTLSNTHSYHDSGNWRRDRHTDQQDRTACPQTALHNTANWFLTKVQR